MIEQATDHEIQRKAMEETRIVTSLACWLLTVQRTTESGRVQKKRELESAAAVHRQTGASKQATSIHPARACAQRERTRAHTSARVCASTLRACADMIARDFAKTAMCDVSVG